MHFYAWNKGLKTGMYYLRSKAAVDPIKFTLSEKHQQKFVSSLESDEIHVPEPKRQIEAEIVSMSVEGQSCSMEDGCLSCGA